VVPTLALYDTMQYVRSKTATVCYGQALGMGGFLLAAGGEKVRGGPAVLMLLMPLVLRRCGVMCFGVPVCARTMRTSPQQMLLCSLLSMQSTPLATKLESEPLPPGRVTLMQCSTPSYSPYPPTSRTDHSLSPLPQGYRYAMPHSILMMHHPSGTSRGQASEMHIESRELVRVRDYLSLVTSEATGQPYDRVIRELSRNKWMDPKEAVEYGMIDKVLTTPMPKMPTGPAFKYEPEPGTSGMPGF
jgi:ATP-dependent protease ClpP protease subunit